MADSKNRKEVCSYVTAKVEKSILADSKKFKLTVSRIVEAHVLRAMSPGSSRSWDPRIGLIRHDDQNPTCKFDKKVSSYVLPIIYKYIESNSKKFKLPKSKLIAALIIKNLQTKNIKSWDPRYILLEQTGDSK